MVVTLNTGLYANLMSFITRTNSAAIKSFWEDKKNDDRNVAGLGGYTILKVRDKVERIWQALSDDE